MEDILASIRRILSEDEAASASDTETGDAGEPEILSLDEWMLVEETEPAALPAPPPQPAAATERSRDMTVTPTTADEDPRSSPGAAEPSGTALVAPEAAEAAASSVGALLRTLNVDRPAPVHVTRAGVTLEEIVRDELRPMLKAWLDQSLPALVERLVRAEIERVVGRARGG